MGIGFGYKNCWVLGMGFGFVYKIFWVLGMSIGFGYTNFWVLGIYTQPKPKPKTQQFFGVNVCFKYERLKLHFDYISIKIELNFDYKKIAVRFKFV